MTGPRPAEPVRLSDDELGSLAVSLVVAELQLDAGRGAARHGPHLP